MRWYHKLNIPILLVHEGVHYLTARLLGLQAKMYIWPPKTNIQPDSKTDWRILPVTMMPTILGILWGVVAIVLGVIQAPYLIPLGMFVIVGWLLICLDDLYRFWFFVKRKRWPWDHEVPSMETGTDIINTLREMLSATFPAKN